MDWPAFTQKTKSIDNDYERRLFEGVRVSPDLRTLNYLEEPPPLTARFGG